MPKWVKEQLAYGSDLIGVSLYALTLDTRMRDQKRLRGYLFKDILERAEKKAYGKLTPHYDMFLFFAHDTTIAILLDTLGLFSPVEAISNLNIK